MGGCRCRQTPVEAASTSRALHRAFWGSESDQNLTAGQQSSSAAASFASRLLTARLTDLSKWGISSLATDSPDSVHQTSCCGFFARGRCLRVCFLPAACAHCIWHILLFLSSPAGSALIMATLIQFRLHLCVWPSCYWQIQTEVIILGAAHCCG